MFLRILYLLVYFLWLNATDVLSNMPICDIAVV